MTHLQFKFPLFGPPRVVNEKQKLYLVYVSRSGTANTFTFFFRTEATIK